MIPKELHIPQFEFILINPINELEFDVINIVNNVSYVIFGDVFKKDILFQNNNINFRYKGEKYHKFLVSGIYFHLTSDDPFGFIHQIKIDHIEQILIKHFKIT